MQHGRGFRAQVVSAVHDARHGGGLAETADVHTRQDAAGNVIINPATRMIYRTVPSYWRFDARVGYAFNDRVDLSVNVNNLTDKTYFNQVYTSHYAAIAPGRSAIATLNVKY